MLTNQNCACCSGKNYIDCCKPYLEDKLIAPTAEALMRSRYTAFATKKVNYLIETHHTDTVNGVSFSNLLSFCNQVVFTGLKVLKTKQGKENDLKGWVKFKANFTEKEVKDCIAEHSYFEKVNGFWKYKSGKYF